MYMQEKYNKNHIADCDLKYEIWFAGIQALSNRKKYLLRERVGSGKEIYNIEEKILRQMEFLTEKDIHFILDYRKKEIQKDYERLQKKNIEFVPYFDDRFPSRLKMISAPPYALYVKGKLPDENRLTVGMVGARNCTPYGRQMAVTFAESLALNGAQIVSGMARGIDGASQRGALNVGGASYGVLGCGADVCYPREHMGLYMDLQQAGGIISEQPTGSPPLREYFPARNRIISGLSDLVLVMEARERSGSLITADFALEQGKEVFALPGPVTSTLSKGCNCLIRQGAGILISPEDFLKELEISGCLHKVNIAGKTAKKEKMLESAENIVYSCLDLYPKSFSMLEEETRMNPAELMDKLISLELNGYIKEVSKNYYIRADER